jgi:hypothetical protein
MAVSFRDDDADDDDDDDDNNNNLKIKQKIPEQYKGKHEIT